MDSILADKIDTVKAVLDTASIFNKSQVEEYKKGVINKGDPDSFVRLIINYEDKSNYKELQKYAVIMADKYNNGDGCSQAFVNIVAINNDNKYDDINNLPKYICIE